MPKKTYVIKRYFFLIVFDEAKYQTFCALCLEQSVREHVYHPINKLRYAI